MNRHDLKTWLDTERPGWRSEPPEEVAAWANAPTVERPADCTVEDLQKWATNSGVLPRLLAAQAAGDPVAAETMLLLGGKIQALDLASPGAQRLVVGLTTHTLSDGEPILSSTAAASLAALGRDYIGAAQAAGLGNVRALDVVRAGRLD